MAVSIISHSLCFSFKLFSWVDRYLIKVHMHICSLSLFALAEERQILTEAKSSQKKPSFEYRLLLHLSKVDDPITTFASLSAPLANQPRCLAVHCIDVVFSYLLVIFDGEEIECKFESTSFSSSSSSSSSFRNANEEKIIDRSIEMRQRN